jgi:hypothetical protein
MAASGKPLGKTLSDSRQQLMERRCFDHCATGSSCLHGRVMTRSSWHIDQQSSSASVLRICNPMKTKGERGEWI